MENRTFNANSRFKEERKKGIQGIVKFFIAGNLINIAMFCLYSSMYKETPLKIPTLLVFIVGSFMCNYSVYLGIKNFSYSVKTIDFHNGQIELSIISVWGNKEKIIILSYTQISVSKRSLDPSSKSDLGRGLTIRNKKNRKQYYIVEGYFNEYDSLSEILKRIKDDKV